MKVVYRRGNVARVTAAVLYEYLSPCKAGRLQLRDQLSFGKSTELECGIPVAGDGFLAWGSRIEEKMVSSSMVELEGERNSAYGI
jgi:hypothetical protein